MAKSSKHPPVVASSRHPIFKNVDLILFVIFFVSLLLRWMIPATIVPNSPNDDFLGILQANALINGHWLGVWTPDILSKPPAYSFFLMFAHYVPVDPTVFIHIFYLLISMLFLKYAADYFHNFDKFRQSFFRIGFLFLAFNPMLFANDFSRIYRTSLNTLASLLFFTLILKLVTLLKAMFFSENGTLWIKTPIRRYLGVSLGLGLTYAIMILTRSEGYWVLIPTMSLVVGIWIYSIVSNRMNWRLKKKYRSVIVLRNILLIAVIGCILPVGIVSSINKSTYGVYQIENYYSGNFARAIKLWQGVESGKSSNLFIPVSKEQRAAVYGVSPAALTLKPVLDGPPNTGWKVYNCSSSGICDESGGWFTWELRSAAVSQNNITNEVDFQKFFGRLADQIDSACESEALKCGKPGLAPGVRAISDYPLHQLLDTSVKAFNSLLTVEQAANVGHPDHGQDAEKLKLWQSTINFRHLVIPDTSNSWQSMANTIKFLRNIYQVLLPLFFAIGISSIFLRRKSNDGILNFYLIALLGGMLICTGGLAIVESSFGMGIAYSLYALPMQPLLLAFIVLSFGNITYKIGQLQSKNIH